MGKGKIEIRARISAAQDFLHYEMADELSKGSKITVYFNQDPDGIGSTFSDFQSLTDENGKRSDIDNDADGNLIFNLYIKHPSYERVVDDEENRKEYLAEEMLKQMVRAHIAEGNYSILNFDEEHELSEEEFEALSGAELMQKIYFTIDKLQFNRLKI
jgi:C1A family cysteine protease